MEHPGRSQLLYLGRLKHCLLLCVCLVVLLVQSAPCNTVGKRTVCEGELMKFPKENISATVTDLDISKNRLSSIEQDTLDTFVKIRKLNLSRNLITTIHNKAFFLLTDIETLDLSFNRLKEISDNILYNNAKLKWFSIAHNRDLKYIPQLQSKSLANFNVSTCGIQDMNETTFQEVESIKVLDLSFNELTEIRYHTFDALTLLRELDVSNNKLQNARFINSDCSLSLTYLDISSNNISVLDLSTFQILLTLRNVHFNNNPWRCNEDMKAVYESVLKSEFTLNLICIFPSDATNISWHDWYYTIDHAETKENGHTCSHNSTFAGTTVCNITCHIASTTSDSSCYVVYIMSVIVGFVNVLAAFALTYILLQLKERQLGMK